MALTIDLYGKVDRNPPISDRRMCIELDARLVRSTVDPRIQGANTSSETQNGKL